MGRRLDLLEDILQLLTKTKPKENKTLEFWVVLWNSYVYKEDIFGDLVLNVLL